MKNTRVITWAALVMATALPAAAQTAGPFFDNVRAQDYPLHERFIDGQRFAFTVNLPALTSLELESLSGLTSTDGSGRIAGQTYARLFYTPGVRITDYSAYTINVIGTTGDKGTNPQVKVTLRGKGYDFVGATAYPDASLTLKFTSTNHFVDVPARPSETITNANYSITFADGTTQLFNNGPATLTNSAFTFLSGKMTGNTSPGKSSPLKKINFNETGLLVTEGSTWSVVDGTNFVERKLSGGLVLDVLTNIDAQVIQPVPNASKLYLNAWVGSHEDLQFGNGSANYGGAHWSATFNGVAFTRGSRFQANGDLGPLIVAYDPVPGTTNVAPRVVPNAIRTMEITSGKIFGQKVQKTQGITVPATPP